MAGRKMRRDHIIVYVTCASKGEAERIGKSLLGEKLIACANIVGGVHSLFWWKGKIDSAKESLIIAKTAKKNFAKLIKRVRQLHSYEVPEIIAVPIEAGDRDYLRWIGDSVKR